ncbi:MAG: phosphocholine cytidylyltransferase family protein [Ignavibacteriales bacterium]|nr:phosphocholine cytidylyltransferase family protein [Ignavibacteriales bacterium]
MKCVLLAAGIGKRMRPVSRTTPKCLLPLGKKPLLERIIASLHTAGIADIALVTGYRAAAVRAFVNKRFRRHQIAFLHNKRFETTNNAYSLSLCNQFIGRSPFMLLDSDILFDGRIIAYLMNCERKPNRLAVRVRGPHNEEEIRVKINRWDHITAINKHVGLRDTYGESIGIALFSAPAAQRLFEILNERIKAGSGRREFYEAAFQQLIDEGNRLWAIDISQFPSAEIDTPEDFKHAEEVILPLLNDD